MKNYIVCEDLNENLHRQLKPLFIKNFERYEANVSEVVKKAGLKLSVTA